MARDGYQRSSKTVALGHVIYDVLKRVSFLYVKMLNGRFVLLPDRIIGCSALDARIGRHLAQTRLRLLDLKMRTRALDKLKRGLTDRSSKECQIM